MKWRLNENSKIIVPGSVTDYWYLFNGRSFEAISPAVNGANLEFTVSKNKTIISLIRTNFDVLNPVDADEQRKAEQIRADLRISNNINAHRINDDDSSLGVIEHYDARGGKQVVSDYSGVHIYVPKEDDEIGMYGGSSSENIIVAHSDSLAITGDQTTVVKAKPLATARHNFVIKVNSYNALYTTDGGGELKAYIWHDTTNALAVSSNAELQPNAICWLASIYDSNTKLISFYKNAIELSLSTQTAGEGARKVTTDSLTISPMTGIYVVLIYNRKLTQSELEQIQQGNIPTNGLVLHHDYTKKLTLSDGKIPDLSGNGNHGTINGAKWVNYAELDRVGIG
ncbi:MAG: hypothetical protein DRJ03_30420 [Chloroflexi bacterium]|nr:MAG: hypothetical protein DRJ03_30420 [Chloroflexota bacterium]